MKIQVNIFWFRRDLRLEDNVGLYNALSSNHPVLPLFIFDTDILKGLEKDDPRVTFIYETMVAIDQELKKFSSGMLIRVGNPLKIFRDLVKTYRIAEVYANRDYEPYGIQRDNEAEAFLQTKSIRFNTFKDHVIFEKDEVIKPDRTPYTVYTPYMKRWMDRFSNTSIPSFDVSSLKANFFKGELPPFSSFNELGFTKSNIQVPAFRTEDDRIKDYQNTRDIPSESGTTLIGTHLRFGTVSIRELVKQANIPHQTFLKELIWREFFMQILFHFPQVVTQSFKTAYDNIEWINNEEHFDRWCRGETGFPFVDAGMRELNATGFMHNRARMVTASFLCKHLLTDWRWGEAYFAKKLLDYELSSNNGNWQWAAGTGCDAAPYFRVFNPMEQQKKFDSDFHYIKKWVPEVNTSTYPQPVVDHKEARERAIRAYKKALS